MIHVRRLVRALVALARPRVAADDAGSAIVEFVTAGVLLLIPTVYLVVAMARIQAGVFATEGGARSAARTLSAADTEAEGRAAAARIVGYALSDQGFDDDPVSAATGDVLDRVLPDPRLRSERDRRGHGAAAGCPRLHGQRRADRCRCLVDAHRRSR